MNENRNSTFNYSDDEAFIYRKGKYLRTKCSDSIPFEMGDRILPVAYSKNGWKYLYKPNQITIWMKTPEKKEKALEYIQTNHNWKIISDRGTFKELSLADDPRGIHTVVDELTAFGFFFECNGLHLFLGSSSEKYAPPFNVWQT